MNNVIFTYILNILIFVIILASCQTVKEKQPFAMKRSDNNKQAEWMTKVEGGNKVAKNKQWRKALGFYNEALNLMNDPIATPQAPSTAEIKKVLSLASQAQLLANSLGDNTRSIVNCNTMMRNTVRGFKIQKHLIPVQFEFSKTTFSEKGKKSAAQLAVCLKQRQQNDNLSQIELIGHTDEKGNDEFNDKLSLKRAKALKKYLNTKGITIDISTTGKGETQPLQLENSDNYTQEEIDQLNRRVEIITQ